MEKSCPRGYRGFYSLFFSPALIFRLCNILTQFVTLKFYVLQPSIIGSPYSKGESVTLIYRCNDSRAPVNDGQCQLWWLLNSSTICKPRVIDNCYVFTIGTSGNIAPLSFDRSFHEYLHPQMLTAADFNLLYVNCKFCDIWNACFSYQHYKLKIYI